ncbi:hypothetical protein M0813_13437 [Anaeramoeba flamelloides]|uniref:BTB domain-containing protein n=1 Tax=Anaeramoeba flamelloides TaxID=1746091 RepID=A0ABQ8Z8E2_9EUKA|nr:hypothetical protein M0813_13437 [Anaeramoeba flamelloides]
MSLHSEMFACGYNKHNQLRVSNTLEKNNQFGEVKELEPISQIAMMREACVFLHRDQTLRLIRQGNTNKTFTLKHNVKKIVSGYRFVIVLTHEGVPYIIGKHPQTATETWEPVPFKYFETNNIFIKGCCCGYHNTFLLSLNGDVYAIGTNDQYQQLGLQKENISKAIGSDKIILKNIKQVYGGNCASCFAAISFEDELFFWGRNDKGQLGLNHKNPVSKPTKLDCNFEISDIKTICTGYEHNIILFNDGKLFGAGQKGYSGLGLGGDAVVFTQYAALKEKNVIFVALGGYHTLAITDEDEIFSFGGNYFGQTGSGTYDTITTARKIEVKNLKTFDNLKIECGPINTFIYHAYDENSQSNFQKLREISKTFDNNIHGINVHQIWIEKRSKKPFNEVKNIIETDFNKDDAETFISWAYTAHTKNYQILMKILNKLGIRDLKDIKIKDDLMSLYRDEDSKDFSILVKMEDEDEDEEEDEDNLEEIPVHKFILESRSGLFRELFETIKEDMKKIQDYSQKTIETIEKLVYFFYIDDIELTADDDPQLIVEELEDAVEYYQMGKMCNLPIVIKKIKKQFDLD